MLPLAALEMDGPALSLIGFWVCVALMVVLPSYFYYNHLTRKAEVEASLKQEMVARGFSAEEIIAVTSGSAKGLASSRKSSGMTPSKLPPEQAVV
jgi:hypothetical protein